MKTVKEIHEFFMKRKDGKELSLGDFMDTVPGFIVEKDETGGEMCNWTMAQEYYRICEKMGSLAKPCVENLAYKADISNIICTFACKEYCNERESLYDAC